MSYNFVIKQDLDKILRDTLAEQRAANTQTAELNQRTSTLLNNQNQFLEEMKENLFRIIVDHTAEMEQRFKKQAQDLEAQNERILRKFDHSIDNQEKREAEKQTQERVGTSYGIVTTLLLVGSASIAVLAGQPIEILVYAVGGSAAFHLALQTKIGNRFYKQIKACSDATSSAVSKCCGFIYRKTIGRIVNYGCPSLANQCCPSTLQIIDLSPAKEINLGKQDEIKANADAVNDIQQTEIKAKQEAPVQLNDNAIVAIDPLANTEEALPGHLPSPTEGPKVAFKEVLENGKNGKDGKEGKLSDDSSSLSSRESSKNLSDHSNSFGRTQIRSREASSRQSHLSLDSLDSAVSLPTASNVATETSLQKIVINGYTSPALSASHPKTEHDNPLPSPAQNKALSPLLLSPASKNLGRPHASPANTPRGGEGNKPKPSLQAYAEAPGKPIHSKQGRKGKGKVKVIT